MPANAACRGDMALCFAYQVASIQTIESQRVADVLTNHYASLWRVFYNEGGRLTQQDLADFVSLHRDLSPLAEDAYRMLFPVVKPTSDIKVALAGAVPVDVLGEAIEVHIRVLLQSAVLLFNAAVPLWVPAHSSVARLVRFAGKAVIECMPVAEKMAVVSYTSGPVQLSSAECTVFTAANCPPCLWHTINCCNGTSSGRPCCSAEGRHPLDPERHMVAALLSSLQNVDAVETQLFRQMFGSEADVRALNTKGFIGRAIASTGKGRPYGITCDELLAANLCPKGTPADIEDMPGVRARCSDQVDIAVRTPKQLFLRMYK